MEYSETLQVYLNKESEQKFLKYMDRYQEKFQLFNSQPNGEYIIKFYDVSSIRLEQRIDRFVRYTHRKRIMCVFCGKNY